MTTILMFPGQSSRYPEMLAKLAPLASSRDLLATANDVLHRDLVATLDLSTNLDVQLGVFLANHLHLARLASFVEIPPHSLGLSLGEYNHLVHIGALSFADALRLIAVRGRLYDEAQGGLMVSVFPLEAEPIVLAIAQLGLTTEVGIALYNSPRQQVIAGPRASVERVLALLEQDEYFAATTIEPRIPMHAPCFGETARRFADALADTPFATPRADYIPNTLGEICPAATVTPAAIRARLTEHVHRPVRWRASVEAIAARVSDALFLEVGPRAVLHNLFTKDWTPGRRAKTDATEGAFAALELAPANAGAGRQLS